MSGESKFREDLRNYFPRIYRILSAEERDPHLARLHDAELEMQENGMYGETRAVWQAGKVNQAFKNEQITAEHKNREHY